MTPLQKQVYNLKPLREAMQTYLTAETGLQKGYKRASNQLYKVLIESMTDQQLLNAISCVLQGDAATPAERAQIIAALTELY